MIDYGLCLIVLSLLMTSTNAQAPIHLTGDEVIAKSIKYHDPKGMLGKKELTFVLSEERPNGSDRSTEVTIDVRGERVVINSLRERRQIATTWHAGDISSTIDGNSDISQADIETYRLTAERQTFMKDYYRYLWHLPSALQDPGTIVSQEVQKTDFFGHKLIEVKVAYDPAVGKDIWYFYFDPTTYALSGYRFYHDESINDGEYIILSGETTMGKLRLPQRREWYTHKEAKYLGADVLTAIK